MSQNKYMEKALLLANKAKKINEIPVGSVIVDRKGEIIASSYNTNVRDKDPTAHAEINALNNCSEDPTGSDLYVNLEPCSFFGKTPPCIETIISNSINNVYIEFSM